MVKTKPSKKEEKFPQVRLNREDYLFVKKEADKRVTTIAHIIHEALVRV
jgi:hypothetical protein